MQYGGGDPMIKYIRLKHEPFILKPDVDINEFNPYGYFKSESAEYAKTKNPVPYKNSEFKWLVVCGKYYLIQESYIHIGDDKVFSYEPVRKVVSHKFTPLVIDYIIRMSEDWIKSSKKSWHWDFRDNKKFLLKDIIGLKDPVLDKLSLLVSEKVGEPVPIFIIENSENIYKRPFRRSYEPHMCYDFNINVNVVLEDLGFASLMNAEQLYQDIATYITNVLRSNPDITPPVQVSDKDKIGQHGFDLKQSFRHRKEE